MTKEEKIKEAYGKHWGTVKHFVNMEDGSCCGVEYDGPREIINHPSLNELGIYQHDNFAKAWYDSFQYKHFWRPISLEGIENNNGWIKIESEADLPKEKGIDCHFILKTGVHGVFINLDDSEYLTLKNRATHYQLIKKPKPPIY